MSANFASASSQRLTNASSPITGYPFTFACWLFPTNTAAKTAITFGDTGTTNNYWALRSTGATNLNIAAAAGGVEAAGSAVVSTMTNKWVFAVCRCISATNRRIAVAGPTGAATHGTNSTSRIPSGVDTISVGSLETSAPSDFWEGGIGEVWYTDTDIQADGAQLQDSLLRQLAYGGPFSVPHIAKDIVEYRSLKSSLGSTYEDWREVYSGGDAKQTWTNTNGATIGPHVPLPGSYVKMSRPYRTRAHKMIRSPLIIPALAGAAYTPPNRSLRTNTLMMMGAGR